MGVGGDCVSQVTSQDKGAGKGGVRATKLSFGVTQHPKQASGVISHSSRAERHRICVKMENRNTGKVMEANMADGPFLALCFTAAQLFMIYSSCCCKNRQLFSLNLWDLVRNDNVQKGFGIN